MKTVIIINGPTGPTGTYKTVNILATGPTGSHGIFPTWLQATGNTGPTGLFETVIDAGIAGLTGRETVIIADYPALPPSGFAVLIGADTAPLLGADGAFLTGVA